MKYTVLGFQQQKLLDNKLTLEDAFILSVIKDMYSSDRMESIIQDGKRYVWINQSYILEQIPILGSMSKLKRMLKRLCDDGFLESILITNKKGVAGRFYYVKYTSKLNDLEDYDCETKVQNDTRPNVKMTLNQSSKRPNKDSSINDSSINNIYTFWNEHKIIVHKKVTKDMEKAFKKAIVDYSEEDIKTAITNYSKILKGDEYFFNYKWGLDEFLSRGVKKFLNWEVCSSNFTKDNIKPKEVEKEEKANCGAYKEWRGRKGVSG